MSNVRAALAALAATVLVLSLSGCAPSPRDAAHPRKHVIDLRRDPPASQDRTLRAFVADARAGARSALVLVQTTVEGDPIEYGVDVTPGAQGALDARLVLDARRDRYWGPDRYRTYEVAAVSVTLSGVPPGDGDHPLTPDAGVRERPGVAVLVLRDGTPLFDSSAAYPILEPATPWRK